MNEPPRMPALICQRCGATNPPHSLKCWLCERQKGSNPYAAPTLTAANVSTAAHTQAQSRVQWAFLVLLIACTVSAVLIGVGLAVQDAGLLIPYLIVIAPAFLATGVRAVVIVGRNERPQPSTLFFTFLWSGLFTALVLILLIIASVIALFLWCVQMLTAT